MMVWVAGIVKVRICLRVLAAMWALCGAQGALIIILTRTPQNPTNQTNALFAYTITDSTGNNRCVDNCTISCQVDVEAPYPCSDKVVLVRNVSANQEHTFRISVNDSSGQYALSLYRWFVDTIPPTASVRAEESFTNALNVSVNITFSEACPGHGGFKCSNQRDCDLIVNGPAEVIPSSSREVEVGLKYRILVVLSEKTLFGRVVLHMARNFCTDQAGNSFMRRRNSSFIIHFDRRPLYVNLWTAIPALQIYINHKLRTIQATNKVNNLKIFLDFNEPIVNSSAEIVKVLHLSTGFLMPIHRKSHGNRRFGFQLTNLSSVAVVSVNLQTEDLISRTGAVVSPAVPVTFLYDTTRPEVHLSTNSQGKTKAHDITILIEFTEPVFTFDSSGVAIHGGRITRFKELSKTAYVLNVIGAIENVVSVFVPENKASDISGNLNLPSNQLEVRHYSVPSISITLYSFTTAGLLATSFAAGLLAVSSATLATAGALSSATAGSIIADPSGNLLGMAGHLQVFAFSNWLSVSLPIEYHETTRGLRWLIPHSKLPWKSHETKSNTFDPQFVLDSPDMSTVNPKRSLISDEPTHYQKSDQYSLHSNLNYFLFIQKQESKKHTSLKWFMDVIKQLSLGQKLILCKESQKLYSDLQTSLDTCSYGLQQSWNLMHQHNRAYKERKLQVNSTMYGPALELNDYMRFFVNQSEHGSAEKLLNGGKKYTGWEDFGMNMFWLGVAGGTLIVLHILVVIFMMLRARTSIRGALSIPRFEIFLLMLTLPSMCQASAFIIRGGTAAGIAIGVVLLALPAAFLLSVFLFLTVAVFMGDLVQYKEIRHENEKAGLCGKIIAILVGRNAIGKWFRKEGLPSSFLSRFGILFEDRKGPAKLVFVNEDNPISIPKWIESGTNGIGRMRAVNSDDDNEETTVSSFQRVIGSARSAYLILDLVKRATLGIIFGAYQLSDHSWSQNSIAFGFTVLQLLCLVLLKPYIRRGIQIVESICLLCESGIFAAGFVLLADQHPSKDHKGIGIFMLVLLFVSFVSQVVNEWYSLMKRLVRLAPSQQPSLKLGLKLIVRGMILPLIPHRFWSKFVMPEASQPNTGLVPVAPFSPEVEHKRRVAEAETTRMEPILAVTEDVVPTYHPGSPCFIDPRTVPPLTEGESEGHGEIRAESSPKAGQIWNQWGKARSLEGKRSKGTKSESRSSELKMLRELAKASFPGIRKDEDPTEIGGSVELAKASPSSAPEEVKKATTGSALRRKSYSEEFSSEDESEAPSPMESPFVRSGASCSVE